MVALPTTHLLSDALSLVRAMAADAAVSSLLRRFRFREATRLQQWFEYCPNLKKRSCPVCKQACTNASVGRLYFQSVGDSNDCISQKPRSCEQTPEELQNEVNRLEGKVAGLSSSLERQQKDFKEVKDELLKCSEQLKTEVALKVEAQIRTSTSQQLLRVKSEALDRSTSECTRLKEKNLALAKELAAFISQKLHVIVPNNINVLRTIVQFDIFSLTAYR